MRAFPELITMLKGMIRALRAISSSLILVGIMTYCFAILLHMLLKDEYGLNERLRTEILWWGLDFTGIADCMWILFFNGTLMLDNANPLMSVMMYSGKVNVVIAGIIFVTFVILTALVVVQMLIGVLVDVV